MKKLACLSLLSAVALTAVGCFSYERRASRTVVVDPAPTASETYITTLPSGYRTRVYQGNTYYYTRDVVYRTRPAGGYTVVTRPW